MKCPRLDHFVRFNPDGTVSCCGHMVDAAKFNNLQEMRNSKWLQEIKQQFDNNCWPKECARCQQTELESNTSVRLYAITNDNNETLDDYLQVGGVLDNLCNAGCLSCNPECSTHIGSLYGRSFPVINNMDAFKQLPQDKILHLDINGGEPSYSKNYKSILKNLPKNLKTLRLNTNCSTVLTELVVIAEAGVEVTVTASIDGVKDVFELTRWPVKWNTFVTNLMEYKNMPVKLNLWTTVSVLNVDDLPNIIAFAKEHSIDHSYAYLEQPAALSVKNLGQPISLEYIQRQKDLRGIK